MASTATLNQLKLNDEFWSAEKTKAELSSDKYFGHWPDELAFLDEQSLAMSAVGGCVFYLTKVAITM